MQWATSPYQDYKKLIDQKRKLCSHRILVAWTPLDLVAGLFGGRHIKMVDFKSQFNRILQYIADLMESRDLSTVVDRTFSLDNTAEAIQYLENV